MKRRNNRFVHRTSTARGEKLSAATLAAKYQVHEQQRELIYSYIALIMKLGLVAVGFSSLLKLGLASHHRVNRHIELSSALSIENAKLLREQRRFDRLFTIGGSRRYMEGQDQWITPNTFRVIWR